MPRFTPDFLDELKSRLRPSDVIGRYVKLKRQGNAYWGLSPFKPEKTPSFSVDDRRGSYHCFSTQKHGDIITFLIETQGLSFPEAVEQLASEAGMVIPAESPAEAERAEKAQGLAEACAAAAKFYTQMLFRSDGRHALDYLRGRQITDAQIETFGLGYAPSGRHALKDYLLNKDFDEVLVESGLPSNRKTAASYDRFRNRVMFPILGGRDRVIAFGGRALDADAKAKYLNSPETPLFHKGSVLYNFARSAAAEDKVSLVVCEGYIDVMALWGAGIRRAVAPLGTALTEDQLALLWRVSDEPLLCFDGDSAAVQAAYRSIDRALPLLKPGKSLNFVFLPEGQDPDDLIRKSGAAAMAEALANTRPLVDVLWTRETTTRPLDTPERRAALRSHLREMVKAIADKDVRRLYGAELSQRLEAEFRPAAAPDRYDPARARNPFRDRQGEVGPAERAKGDGPKWTGNGVPGTPRRPGRPPGSSRPPCGCESGEPRARRHSPPYAHRTVRERVFNLDLADPDLKGLLRGRSFSDFEDPGLDREGLKSHLSRNRRGRSIGAGDT
ncbi:MAG: DNA primase [Parvularculaceae bacterium]